MSLTYIFSILELLVIVIESISNNIWLQVLIFFQDESDLAKYYEARQVPDGGLVVSHTFTLKHVGFLMMFSFTAKQV